MPFIDQANIACGVHAGSPEMMRETLLLAKAHGVSVGAHPGYADREGFGRESMPCNSYEIVELVRQQISALGELAISEGITIDYVKPHGALYHDMLNNTEIRSAIYLAVSQSPTPLALLIQATPKIGFHRTEAAQAGLTPGQYALKWTLDQPGISSCVVGAKRIDQIESLIPGCQ